MFIKNQTVFYIPGNVMAEVLDPGSTLTSIVIFSMDYNSGSPTVLTAINEDLIDYDEYLADIRDKKIENIIN